MNGGAPKRSARGEDPAQTGNPCDLLGSIGSWFDGENAGERGFGAPDRFLRGKALDRKELGLFQGAEERKRDRKQKQKTKDPGRQRRDCDAGPVMWHPKGQAMLGSPA